MASDEGEFVAYLVDLMQSVGPVRARRMFGGHGIFLDGLMFALVADATLYLKVDPESVASFQSRGLEPFRYRKKGKTLSMSYYQAPEEVLEDAGAMNAWANLAYAAALRSAAGRAGR